jgi:APA family basic amino acid/polyamine antiporter
VIGVVGCLALVVSLPPASIGWGVLLFAVGLAGRAVALRRRAG